MKIRSLLYRLALFAFCFSGCQGNADFSEAAPPTITLNADEYQREIRAIDRLLFEERPMDRGQRAALAGELEGLARRIRERSTRAFWSSSRSSSNGSPK